MDAPRSDNLWAQHLQGTRAPESALTLSLFLLQLGGHTSTAVTTFPTSLGEREPPPALIWAHFSPTPKACEFTASDLRTKRCPGGSVARARWGWGHAWGVQSLRRGVWQGWRATAGLGEAGLKDEAACGARISSEKGDSRDRRLGLVTSPRAERRWRC